MCANGLAMMSVFIFLKNCIIGVVSTRFSLQNATILKIITLFLCFIVGSI